jgi:hypothetical protein
MLSSNTAGPVKQAEPREKEDDDGDDEEEEEEEDNGDDDDGGEWYREPLPPPSTERRPSSLSTDGWSGVNVHPYRSKAPSHRAALVHT